MCLPVSRMTLCLQSKCESLKAQTFILTHSSHSDTSFSYTDIPRQQNTTVSEYIPDMTSSAIRGIFINVYRMAEAAHIVSNGLAAWDLLELSSVIRLR